jgi:3-deoxy-manno-octulosonate cytidylyltransferase (CMP-KDO synthetase)
MLAGMKCVAIIPARYASTRLPGKAIRPEIKAATGRFLIELVHERARRARTISEVIVATDDQRIADVVRGFGGRAELTSEKHQSGTDRIAEVARKLSCDIVLNLQGDEPDVHPDVLDQTVELLASDPLASMSTMANPIESETELQSPNAVKVIVDRSGYALYFSRFTIPYVRDKAGRPSLADFPFLKHIGIYGYRRDFLLHYASLPPSSLEKAERLEQLRALENGYRIKVGVTPHRSIGIDTFEDMNLFIEQCRKNARCGR